MLHLLRKLIRRRVAETVNETILNTVEARLPDIIEKCISEKLEGEPDLPLSHAGFGWALSIGLRKHWPDVDGKTAAQWMWEYLGVPHGRKGYTWTYAAACDLAAQYVSDFGDPTE